MATLRRKLISSQRDGQKERERQREKTGRNSRKRVTGTWDRVMEVEKDTEIKRERLRGRDSEDDGQIHLVSV